jgi:hypothetical protein
MVSQTSYRLLVNRVEVFGIRARLGEISGGTSRDVKKLEKEEKRKPFAEVCELGAVESAV